MVKGVNKHIIEITNTGSDHFERAILFLRQDQAEEDGEQLHKRARAYLAGLRLRRGILPKGKLWVALLKYGAALGAGAVCTALLLQL